MEKAENREKERLKEETKKVLRCCLWFKLNSSIFYIFRISLFTSLIGILLFNIKICILVTAEATGVYI